MLLIYSPVITSRCEYVFEFIFKEEFGIPYQVTSNMAIFATWQREKINYSFQKVKDELYINASSLLFEQVIQKIDVPLTEKHGLTVLFPGEKKCDLGFDIFSAVFYMISRYEEYLPFTPDKYGRFPSAGSLARKNDFLQRPVVDTWINIFRDVLRRWFPALQLRESSFEAIATYDIDVAYAFRGRSLFRVVASTLKDAAQLKIANIYTRLRTLINLQRDAWDVYDLLHTLVKKNKLHSIFFFLLGDYSRYDKNLGHNHPLMQKLVKRVSSFSETGIHPSFRASAFPQKIKVEKSRLEKLTGEKTEKSRQHFLKFTLPDTFRLLLEAGITEDYSMGFSDMPGFRAGTCKPFYFYDLKDERQTDLKIFPITFMEGAFMDYLHCSPQEALPQMLKLLAAVKNVNGTFIMIWHNHTISETGAYKGWRYVHDKVIEEIIAGVTDEIAEKERSH